MNNLFYRQANMKLLLEIEEIYKEVIKSMEESGIHQWDEKYPDHAQIESDIRKRHMTVVMKKDDIVAVYVLDRDSDPEYEKGEWQNPSAKYKVIHRLCVRPEYQNQGIAKQVILHIEEKVKAQGAESIRLDVFTQNPYAQKLYEDLEYVTVGQVEWRVGKFKLMEKLL